MHKQLLLEEIIHFALTPFLTADRFGNPYSAYEYSGNYGPYGGGGWIEIPNMINGFTDMTISIWVNIDEWGYIHGSDFITFGIVEQYGSAHIHYPVESGIISFGVSNANNGVSDSGSVHISYNTGWSHTFMHYVLVYDGVSGIVRAYVNGELVGENSDINPGLISTRPEHAGLGIHWSDINTNYPRFNGVFDDVRIYDRVLLIFGLKAPVFPDYFEQVIGFSD